MICTSWVVRDFFVEELRFVPEESTNTWSIESRELFAMNEIRVLIHVDPNTILHESVVLCDIRQTLIPVFGRIRMVKVREVGFSWPYIAN